MPDTLIAIGVHYINSSVPKLEKIKQGDWIDLYAAESYDLYPGDSALVSLGVVIKLPEGYEAHLAPRSSTFKNFNIIQTNGVGVVDESYCGPNDVWKMPVHAIRHATIRPGDKIAQFRIMEKMKQVYFYEMESVLDPDRGGFGSTGKK